MIKYQRILHFNSSFIVFKRINRRIKSILFLVVVGEISYLFHYKKFNINKYINIIPICLFVFLFFHNLNFWCFNVGKKSTNDDDKLMNFLWYVYDCFIW